MEIASCLSDMEEVMKRNFFWEHVIFSGYDLYLLEEGIYT